jgi:hypothetical protein
VIEMGESHAARSCSPRDPSTFLHMRWLIAIALVFMMLGGGAVLHSTRFPVYTDPKAPGRLSIELESLPRETRFKEWYTRLRAYETPHKRIADTGRGVLSAGIGLFAAAGLWSLYHRWPPTRTFRVLVLIWSLLWLVRIPLSFWYHSVRSARFDYPTWGDSIAIGIFSESFTWIVGAALSSLVLGLLLIRYPLPPNIRIRRPRSVHGWLRAIFLASWLVILGVCVIEGISDGNEGMVFTGIVASVILMAFSSAQATSRPDESTASLPSPLPDNPDQLPNVEHPQ